MSLRQLTVGQFYTNKMQFQNIALVLLFPSMHFAYGLHQPDLPSFGDFMEYYLSVSVSCSNVTDARNITNTLTKKFAQCTTKITAPSAEIFGNLRLICENQESYLQCWDQLKQDITTNCHESGHLPTAYPATVKSYCGNDKGNLTISNLIRAMQTMTEKDRDECPEETGIHWLDNCKPSLEAMISENVCERQDALDKCVGKITCMNFEFGRLQKELYSGGKAYVNCDS